MDLSTIVTLCSDQPLDQNLCLQELIRSAKGEAFGRSSKPNKITERLLLEWQLESTPYTRRWIENEVAIHLHESQEATKPAESTLQNATEMDWAGSFGDRFAVVLTPQDRILLAVESIRLLYPSSPITVAGIGKLIRRVESSQISGLPDKIDKMTEGSVPYLALLPRAAKEPKSFEMTDAGRIRIAELRTAAEQVI